MLIYLFSISTANHISAQEEYQVKTTDLTLYRDGIVKVTQEFIINMNTPAVSIPLLSPSIQNIIIVDQLNLPISYEIRNNKLIINTLNATLILIEYDTAGFTTQEGPIWTITLNSTYTITALLPEGSTIIFLNTVPLAITTDQGRNILVMPKGFFEFSYVLPLTIKQDPSSLGDPETNLGLVQPKNLTINEESTPGFNLQNLQFLPLVAGIFFIIIIFGIVFKRRAEKKRVKEQPQLRHDDLEVLKFLEESGGKALELNIRKELIIPKSSSWRLVRRLERLGYIKVTKIGVQNEIELIRKKS